MTVPALTDTGITVPRQADYVSEIDGKFFAQTGITLGSALEANQDQILPILVNIMAELLDNLGQRLPAIVDAQDPSKATGVQLTSLARITNAVRKRATRSQVTVTCTGTAGTVLAFGRVIRFGGPNNDATWSSTSDAVIGSGGSVDVVFECQTAGAIQGPVTTGISIVTPVVGWSAASNASAAAIGVNEEQDTTLRQRRVTQLAQNKGGGAPALRAALLDLSFITEAVVLHNPDSETKVVSGVSLSKNTILPVVLPSVLTDAQRSTVLTTLHQKAPLGIRLGGSESGTIVESDGSSWPVSFDFGGEVTVSVALALELENGLSLADATASVDTAMRAILPLQLGEDLTRLRICSLIAPIVGIRSATVLIDGLDADRAVNITERISTLVVTVT